MLRLIVVDDEKDARDRMIRCIDKEKYGIHIVGAASDGAQACELIRALSPNIVLIDIGMPGMSGLDVINTVLNQYGMSWVVFIIVSSHDNFGYAREALRLGVRDYLLKPFMPSDICEAIYRAAEHLKSMHLLLGAPEARAEAAAPAPLFPKEQHIRMDYPYDEEQKLIHCLRAANAEEALEQLHSFFERVRALNETPAQWNCYVILYIELYHLALSYKIDPAALNLHLPDAARADPEVFQESLRLLSCMIAEKLAPEGSKGSAVLSLALRYVQEHYPSPLTLEKVASEVFISPAYLSTLFSQKLRMHFIDYIHKVRIENAMRIMAESPQLKCYEISERVGYASYKHYAKCFKKVTHMTVSQYQAQAAAASGPYTGGK